MSSFEDSRYEHREGRYNRGPSWSPEQCGYLPVPGILLRCKSGSQTGYNKKPGRPLRSINLELFQLE
jgi:hypothetical protein